MQGRRATIVDVARAAGTSHATVSRYLNKTTVVTPATAAAIEHAIGLVGYTPNQTARSLVRRSTRSIAFVVREDTSRFFADPNLSEMAVGANRELSASGFQMVVLIVDDDESALRIGQLVTGGWVDGAILVAMRPDDPIVDAALLHRTAIVTASSSSLHADVPSVDTDNVGGTRRITELLLAGGRRRIAEIRGPGHATAAALRHDGYAQALGGSLDSRLIVTAEEWTSRAGRAAADTLLERGAAFDALVCASDLLALGALESLDGRGLRVPEDVAVVGFDDAPWAAGARPALTTVHQDARETGRLLAVEILARVAGLDRPEAHVILPNRIVWRDSAGPAPEARSEDPAIPEEPPIP
ncbi:LacI family DNA-binding transcriptional regulator [Rathayibacter sp. VKM Ac-2760]|uniref:LacI family DNA-binding transcriptional regulator n=1 Tax=Rathayibacter sp. VKM Ac-2760 TaxID=2609253 RepID=UPI001ABE819F|nr:LacI family DNA-binding transcriptional regulator [Rathayibacter sp. VKM Ac-2760]